MPKAEACTFGPARRTRPSNTVRHVIRSFVEVHRIRPTVTDIADLQQGQPER
jgi:hypothetical protein